MVDLSDESGNLKYLRGHPESYATEFLKDRESLVLIRVDSKYIIALPSLIVRHSHISRSESTWVCMRSVGA